MSMKKMLKVIMAFMFIFSMAGCGSGADSETNGNIKLVLAPTSGNPYKVYATATFSKAVPNFPINFNWKIISTNDPTGTQPGNFGSSGDISTNNLGVATYTLNVFPTNVQMSVQVEAKSGNVSSGTKGVVIPAL